jgi:hypothetical protein
MGQTPKSRSIEVQNLTMSPFSNVDLVWKKGEQHEGKNKISIEHAYIPHVHVHEFLEGE